MFCKLDNNGSPHLLWLHPWRWKVLLRTRELFSPFKFVDYPVVRINVLSELFTALFLQCLPHIFGTRHLPKPRPSELLVINPSDCISLWWLAEIHFFLPPGFLSKSSTTWWNSPPYSRVAWAVSIIWKWFNQLYTENQQHGMLTVLNKVSSDRFLWRLKAAQKDTSNHRGMS